MKDTGGKSGQPQVFDWAFSFEQLKRINASTALTPTP